jgi:hypothetical protein
MKDKTIKVGSSTVLINAKGQVSAPCGEVIASKAEVAKLLKQSDWYAAQPKRPAQPTLIQGHNVNFRRDGFGDCTVADVEVSRKTLQAIAKACGL